MAFALFVTGVILVLPFLLSAIVSYYFLGSGRDSFHQQFPFWYPFDWRTPLGYLVAWVGQCLGIAGLMTSIPFFNIIFGSSWLFYVMTEDIINEVTAFNKTLKIANVDGDRVAVIEHFHNVIQCYADVKQCVGGFNKMNRYPLFAFLVWNMLAISTILVLIQFQLWDKDSKLFEVILLSFIMLWVIAINLAICEPGERVSAKFDQFDMKLGRCQWIRLPVALQRTYLIFVSDTQQPKYLQSYGGIMCTRGTFKSVLTPIERIM